MTREELCSRLLAVRALKELIAAEETRLRTEVYELFTRPGQREAGTLDGQELGTVQLDRPSTSWQVRDRAAFTAWVEDTHPDEIVRSVNPAFERSVLDRVKRDGGLVDEATGEVGMPPGLLLVQGSPTLKTRLAGDAKPTVLAALGESARVLGLAELEGSDGAV